MVNDYDKFLSVLLRLVKWPFNSLIPYRKVTYETFKSSKNHYMHCYRNSKNHPKTKTICIYIYLPLLYPPFLMLIPTFIAIANHQLGPQTLNSFTGCGREINFPVRSSVTSQSATVPDGMYGAVMAFNSYKWDEITPITKVIYHSNPI